MSVNTAKVWVSLLEASYLAFGLEPYHRSFNKRVGKTPKLYFYDTGLVCYLLGIDGPEALRDHYLYGQIAETYLVAERVETYTNRGRRPRLSFWREGNRHEVDLLEEAGAELPRACELKGGRTFRSAWFGELARWREVTGAGREETAVVYCGEEAQAGILGWRGWLGGE